MSINYLGDENTPTGNKMTRGCAIAYIQPGVTNFKLTWDVLKISLNSLLLSRCLPLLFKGFNGFDTLCKDKNEDVKRLSHAITMSMLNDTAYQIALTAEELPFNYITQKCKSVCQTWCRTLPYFSENWNFLGSAANISNFRTVTLEILIKQADILNRLHVMEKSSSALFEEREFTTFKNIFAHTEPAGQQVRVYYVSLVTDIIVFDNNSTDESLNPQFSYIGNALAYNTMSISTYIQQHIDRLKTIKHELAETIPDMISSLTSDMKTAITTNLPYSVTIDKLPVVEIRHKDSLLLIQTIDSNYRLFLGELKCVVDSLYQEIKKT